MALQRWAARDPGEVGAAEGGTSAPSHGPYDEDDLDPEHTEVGRVDFGAVRVPVPRGGQVTVEPEEGRLQAVHVMLPAGRLSVSALAAPRTERLWPDLAAEIDESLREGGATVRSFTGEWGRELHARTGEASSVFVGVDGPRWMLYGVATGPTGSARELDTALRLMLRGTVVVRGRSPYPVRTVLPLTVPEQLAPAEPLPVERAPAVPAAPAAPPVAPERVGASRPEPGDTAPTVPHGLPRVPPAGAARSSGAGPSGARRAPGAQGGAQRAEPTGRPPATTQRRVADLIAAAEQERAARAAAEPRPPATPTAGAGSRNGWSSSHEPRNGRHPTADPATAGPPSRHSGDPDGDRPALLRLGGAPAPMAADRTGVPTPGRVPEDPAPGRVPEDPAPRLGSDPLVRPVPAGSPPDGSDDWTVPLPTVRAAPMPTVRAAPMPTVRAAPMPTVRAAPMPTVRAAPVPAERAVRAAPPIGRRTRYRPDTDGYEAGHGRRAARHGADADGGRAARVARRAEVGHAAHARPEDGAATHVRAEAGYAAHARPDGERPGSGYASRARRAQDDPRNGGARGVSAARIAPPDAPAAHRADERTDPFDRRTSSGRHRRPER